MIRVTVFALTRTVSFHPISLASGGVASPTKAKVSGVHEFEPIEAAAIEDLKTNQVQVDWVHVIGEVDELPDLGAIEVRFFGDRHVPRGFIEQHAHGFCDHILLLVEGEPAGLAGGGLDDSGYGT